MDYSLESSDINEGISTHRRLRNHSQCLEFEENSDVEDSDVEDSDVEGSDDEADAYLDDVGFDEDISEIQIRRITSPKNGSSFHPVQVWLTFFLLDDTLKTVDPGRTGSIMASMQWWIRLIGLATELYTPGNNLMARLIARREQWLEDDGNEPHVYSYVRSILLRATNLARSKSLLPAIVSLSTNSFSLFGMVIQVDAYRKMPLQFVDNLMIAYQNLKKCWGVEKMSFNLDNISILDNHGNGKIGYSMISAVIHHPESSGILLKHRRDFLEMAMKHSTFHSDYETLF